MVSPHTVSEFLGPDPGEVDVFRGALKGGESMDCMRLGRMFISVLSTMRLTCVPVVFWKSDGRRMLEKS